jgi:hypothetical protein
MKYVVILGVAATALAACGPSNDELRAKLDSRAQFDMNCPNPRAVSLEETNGYVTSYGVTGCGRRATYVLNATTMSWVMNVSDGRPIGEAPGEAPQPPAPNAK